MSLPPGGGVRSRWAVNPAGRQDWVTPLPCPATGAAPADKGRRTAYS